MTDQQKKKAEAIVAAHAPDAPDRIEHLVATLSGGRPSLEIVSTARSVEWIRDNIGTGHLAGMFHRGGEIVYCPRIGEEGYLPLTDQDRDDDGPAQVRPMSVSRIASYIQLLYWCYKLVEDDKTMFPVVTMFPIAAARPAWDVPGEQRCLRWLRGVTHSPLPRADGTILDVPGYDEPAKLLYLPDPDLTVQPVPAEPTAGQVTDALRLLRYMVHDFQFLTDHDEANYLGLLLTPLLREIAPPPYKLGVIGAPQPGSGKSLLAGILRIVHGGVFRSEVPPDDAEMRKVITTILDVTTGPVVQLDNVSGVLRSSVLSGLLTSPTWEDRRLGSNSHMRARNDRLWVLTGNNVTLGGDLVRRACWVTIDPGCPDPHLRSNFKVNNLEQWARDHRGELVHALLVLIRNWVLHGKPTTPRGSDSYARWIETVAGVLTTAGHPGVFDHRDAARQTIGTDDAEWREFLEAVHHEFGENSWTVKELLTKFQPRKALDDNGWSVEIPAPIPMDVLPAELAEKAARSPAGVGLIGKSLGRWLSNRDGRWSGDLTVRRTGEDSHAKTVLWKIENATRGHDQ
jgi:hypothetical protein